MPRTPFTFDPAKFIQPAQVGGIESYVVGEGDARGVRTLCVNTGGGLRYRVLVDRGLDIDQAFFNQHSLAFLSHRGVTPPTRALDRGLDWLKGFPGGLLTSCGPFNIGKANVDQDEELGLHGPHSNTAATIESVVQPNPRRGGDEMSITGIVRYGKLYGPSVELRRTIRSPLGSNAIHFVDEFFNAGNTEVPHAWLLHINFGYPLLDKGAEFCYDAEKVEPMSDHDQSKRTFVDSVDYKRVPAPQRSHLGTGSAVAYLYPRATRDGRATVAIVNSRVGVGVAIRYNTKEFPRCGNWQHWGRHEYVAALEPMNGTVQGRDQDRQRGVLDTIKGGATTRYEYSIEVVTTRDQLDALRAMNRATGKKRR